MKVFKLTVIILKKFMNIGKTNKCNLGEDETLAEVVIKYQCLYDKSFPGYKERDRCKNVWKAVEEKIGLEEGSYC